MFREVVEHGNDPVELELRVVRTKDVTRSPNIEYVKPGAASQVDACDPAFRPGRDEPPYGAVERHRLVGVDP
jgi:hypothetical protein